ncbi:MAG: FliM/FliN family flagellar motor switch protein [Ghiorsea sp.]|nr:FliM/FliN family flagellar motor switch protein [Ghiorsea sp.]
MSEKNADALAEKEPILAPEEIDALMKAVAPSEQAHALLATLPPVPQPDIVEDFDFESVESDNGPERYPLFFNLQQRMAESLNEQWDETFQRDVELSSEGIDERLYQDIIEDNKQTKQVFFVYDVDGFGRMMVTIELPLVIAYIDAMLGGMGEAFDDDASDLTPVEQRLATRIGVGLEKLLRHMWQPVVGMKHKLSKLDTEPQFLAVAAVTDPCFSVKFAVKVSSELQGFVHLHYPLTFLDPVLDNLRTSASDEVGKDPEWEQQLQKSIEQVPLTVRLELGQCQLSIKHFLGLRAGDFLPLRKSTNDPAMLWVGSTPMFEARPGSQDGQLAAELTNHLAQDR